MVEMPNIYLRQMEAGTVQSPSKYARQLARVLQVSVREFRNWFPYSSSSKARAAGQKRRTQSPRRFGLASRISQEARDHGSWMTCDLKKVLGCDRRFRASDLDSKATYKVCPDHRERYRGHIDARTGVEFIAFIGVDSQLKTKQALKVKRNLYGTKDERMIKARIQAGWSWPDLNVPARRGQRNLILPAFSTVKKWYAKAGKEMLMESTMLSCADCPRGVYWPRSELSHVSIGPNYFAYVCLEHHKARQETLSEPERMFPHCPECGYPMTTRMGTMKNDFCVRCRK